MARKPANRFRFRRLAGRKVVYAVRLVKADRTTSKAGTVEHRWYSHIQMMGWEATGMDGHRGVHEERWQAAEALVIDLTNYPFPILRKAA